MINVEKQALLDHAQRCRQTAGELTHVEAARRLVEMADDFETRAGRLEEQEANLRNQAKRRHR